MCCSLKKSSLLQQHTKPFSFATGVPHTAINLSQTEPARAIVARNEPNEQENVVPYSIHPNQDRDNLKSE